MGNLFLFKAQNQKTLTQLEGISSEYKNAKYPEGLSRIKFKNKEEKARMNPRASKRLLANSKFTHLWDGMPKAAPGVSRFHFSLMSEKDKVPLCVARGQWKSNMCSTCCCKASQAGGRPATQNSKSLELKLVARGHSKTKIAKGLCAHWFTGMDTMFTMLSGFV